MAAITLAIGSPDKYGVIAVFKTDGTLEREVVITGAELASLKAAGRWRPEVHGQWVTLEEWKRSVCAGKQLDVGDMKVNKDGSLYVKLDQRGFFESPMVLQAGKWIGTPPVITVQNTGDLMTASTGVQSIVDGVAITLDVVEL